MPVRRVALVLPSDRLADLGLDYQGDAAANLLAAWTTLWHPQLLATTGTIPTIRAVDSLFGGADLDGELLVVPAVTWGDDVDSWRQTLSATAQQLVPSIHESTDRTAIWQSIAQGLDASQSNTDNPPPAANAVSSELAAEFYALGFAYFQIEMLTRVMRYGPLGETTSMATHAVEAARAAIAGDDIDRPLAAAYDSLTQSRNHYYPVDFHLIDVTLADERLLAEPLRRAVARGHAKNLLLAGQLAERIAAEHAATAEAIGSAIRSGSLELIGGSYFGGNLARLSPEQLLADLRRAGTARRLLTSTPGAFANFDGVVAPLLPNLIEQLGYHGVLGANFCGAALPPLYPPRCRWRGIDCTGVEALTTVPLDRGDAGTMLKLSHYLAEAMDNDLTATVVLAGWPAAETPFFDDLCRVAARSDVLGHFCRLSDYFTTTTSADRVESLAASYYRAPQQMQPEAQAPTPGLLALAGGVATGDGTDQQLWADLFGLTVGDPATAAGWLVVNATNQPAYAAGSAALLRGVPAWGFSWEAAQAPPPPVPLSEQQQLRNSELELQLADTGGIGGVVLHRYRGTQLSQKLVLVGDEELQLGFDGHQPPEASDRGCRATSRYRIIDRQGATLAHVVQTCQLSLVGAELRLHWHISDVSPELPTHVQLASRIAWRDQAATVSSLHQGLWLPTTSSRMAGTRAIRIDGSPTPLTLAFDRPLDHRRSELNWLDSWLPVAEGPAVAAAIRFANHSPWQPTGVVRIPTRGRLDQSHGWWLHFSSPHVMATAIEPVDSRTFDLRIVETSGHERRCKIATWRAIESAALVDLEGNDIEQLAIDEGAAMVPLAGYDYRQVRLVLGD
jgi:hypothetical protein